MTDTAVTLFTTGLERSGDFFTHGFTARTGGFGVSPYESLNPALHVGDDPDTVMANRGLICHAAGIPLDSFVFCEQVHGDKVVKVGPSDQSKGAVPEIAPIPGVDGLVTATPGLALGIFTADCVPVYLADPEHRAVGLVHAGWRGTSSRIVPHAIDLMAAEFGTNPELLSVAFGPSIGPECYIVGQEVRDRFIDSETALASSFEQAEPTLWRCDLVSANRTLAETRGVSPQNILTAGICTACDTRFFSYRREGPVTGRILSFIRVNPTE